MREGSTTTDVSTVRFKRTRMEFTAQSTYEVIICHYHRTARHRECMQGCER